MGATSSSIFLNLQETIRHYVRHRIIIVLYIPQVAAGDSFTALFTDDVCWKFVIVSRIPSHSSVNGGELRCNIDVRLHNGVLWSGPDVTVFVEFAPVKRVDCRYPPSSSHCVVTE